ncbi:MAG: ribosome small subunit-dependent GTPase A [Christensenellales bacterium]|jgi:ribosome biogenesis GTPase
MRIKGRVIKAVGGRFRVLSESEYDCLSRGILRLKGGILVGDIVDVRTNDNSNVIEKVYPRKNSLVRPPVANIDTVLITIAPVPRPDFILVDKLIINSRKEGIEPVIVYNKTDISDNELVDNIRAMYDNIVKTLYISAETGEGIDALREEINGKFACFAGQSAVGKTTIINAVTGRELETGELSRIERGRHTTRHIELFNVGGDTVIADTCGFSSLENVDISPVQLPMYYNEYARLASYCRFIGCRHITEPECAVKEAVDAGTLNRERYNRYLTIYEEINKKWSRRYE